jgi:hypothetical protein
MEAGRRAIARADADFAIRTLCRLAASHLVADSTANGSLRDTFRPTDLFDHGSLDLSAYIDVDDHG